MAYSLRYKVGFHQGKVEIDEVTIRYSTTAIKRTIPMNSVALIAIADDRHIYGAPTRLPLQKMAGIQGGLGKLLIACQTSGKKRPACASIMFDFGKPETVDMVNQIVEKMREKYIGFGPSDELLKSMSVSRRTETLWTILSILGVMILSLIIISLR
jgi:hypothetical protein